MTSKLSITKWFVQRIGDVRNYSPHHGLIRARHLSSPTHPPDVTEVEIPVPWGIVAGRHWNAPSSSSSSKTKKPILCLHGWKDNAASFDTLIPLLLKEMPHYHFCAIDLPGHGRSSHFPPGMIYSVQDMWVLIRRIVKHFGWEQISLLSHSMGSQISFSYCGTHPMVVEKMVALDAISPLVLSREDTVGMIPKLTSDIIKFEEKLATGKRPSYTYDEIVAKLVQTHTGRLEPEECKILMSRGVEEVSPNSGRFQFTHDIRVHYMPVTGISSRQVSFIARNFRSDILYIKAKQGVNYTRPYIRSRMEDWLSKEENGDPKGNLVRFVEVEGDHHLHLSKPEAIVHHIVRFLNHDKTINKESAESHNSLR